MCVEGHVHLQKNGITVYESMTQSRALHATLASLGYTLTAAAHTRRAQTSGCLEDFCRNAGRGLQGANDSSRGETTLSYVGKH